jgi:hexosaminidase
MKQFLILMLLLSLIFGSYAQSISLIPQPQEIVFSKGEVVLGPDAIIVSREESFLKQITFFNEYLSTLAGFSLVAAKVKPANSTFISLEKLPATGKPAGSYEMETTTLGITIKADDESGIFYGLNNLIQLLSLKEINGTVKTAIPIFKIKDSPRFSYRGMMLDVARHYRDINYLKQLLDQMALLKLNVFHWHLTDDQGWRIEIKKYPKLTEVGAWRDGTIIGKYPGTGNDNERHGGYYTQEQVKEIVQYAAERHISVIPEIEMPGHSSAAIAAYPSLSCFPEEETLIPEHPSEISKQKKGKKVQESWGVYTDVFIPNELTFKFLQDVIDEIVPLFPGKYIHIGGDECPKEAWKRSDFCQQLIRLKGLKDEHGLQSYFIQRMEKYINSKGKQIIGWDEILEGGLAPNATVMSWRGEAGGIEAAKQSHDVVMSPTTYAYFDYSQTKQEDSLVIGGYLPLEKVYAYNPMPDSLSGTAFETFVKGAQANIWTEYMRSNSKVDYMVYPRIAALSEAVWTHPSNKNWQGFQEKLPNYFSILNKLGIGYSEAVFGLKTLIVINDKNNGVLWKLESIRQDVKIFYMLPGEDNMRPYIEPLPIEKSGVHKAFKIKNEMVEEEISQLFNLHKAVGRKVISLKHKPSPKYPGINGISGLVNGVSDKSGLKNQDWLGWQGEDLETVIDLGKKVELKEVSIHVLESIGSWIYRPKDIIVYISDNNKEFTLAGVWDNRKNDIVEGEHRKVIIPLKNQGNPAAIIKARYIKVWIQNFGEIPAGSPGGGDKAWLFVDEIEVN